MHQLRASVGVITIAILSAVIVLVLVIRHRPVQVSAPVRTDVSSALPSSASSPSAMLTIDVEGKVRRPGLVQLAAGSRVSDAIRAAGGLLPGAALEGLNLARKVIDGEQIVVGQPATASASGSGSHSAVSALINLNTATLAELDSLPGVGPVMAQRILDWRTAHGRFDSLDQLREVEGIGDRTFARLKDLVSV